MNLVGIVVLTSCIFLGLSNLVQAEVVDKEPAALWNFMWATLAGSSAIAAWRWRWWAGVPVTLLGLLGLWAVHLELQEPSIGSAIRIEAGASYTTQFYAVVKAIVQSLPRTKLVEEDETYLHFEFTSLLFRFVDDVEFLFDDEAKMIHFRSASRTGYGDLGVNRRRMEDIRKLLEGKL